MKTKILILSLISVFIFSCKGDDGSEPQNTVTKKLVETINSSGTLIKYTFNGDQMVQSWKFGENPNMQFNYSKNRINTIEYADQVWEFMYDANGKINAFSNGIDEIDVVYNASENSYFYKKEEGIETTLILTENDDVKKYSILNTQTDVSVKLEYFYDNSKNGVLTNSNNIAIYLVMVTNNHFVGLYASKKPVHTFNNNSTALSFENTFDNDEFIIKSVENGSNTIFYSYNQ